MLDTLLQYLRTPLIVLSGTPVTTLTLLAALGIVIVARIARERSSRGRVERVLEARGLDKGLRHSVGKITRYVVITIGVFVALGTIGVDTSAIMAGGAVLLVGIGFGLQKLAENFISGLLLLIERPVRKGDFIDVGGVLGTVEDIGLRATHVMSRDGVTVIVPNCNLISGIVINHTVPTTHRRVWIKLGVAYGTDLDLACKVLDRVALADAEVDEEAGARGPLQDFGESAIQLALVAWIAEAKDDLTISSRLRFAIDKAFREHSIEMPFPQRVIHTTAPHEASLAEARALAITAQRLAGAARGRRPIASAVRALVDKLGVVQIDSVNVLVRSHYLPAFSRLGPYDPAHLDRARPPRAARAVRVLGPRGVAVAGRAAAAVSLAHGARAAPRVEPRAPDRAASSRTSSTKVLALVRDKGPLAAARVELGGAKHEEGLVGVVRREARDRVAVLERPGHERVRGAASSGSTICPSACCRRA